MQMNHQAMSDKCRSEGQDAMRAKAHKKDAKPDQETGEISSGDHALHRQLPKNSTPQRKE